MTQSLALMTFAAASALLAQETPALKYGYEVASIRRADPAEQNSGFSPGPQGGLRARNNTVERLLSFAYNVENYQIVGLPAWATSDRYEITLTPDRPDVMPDNGWDRAQLDGWLVRNRQRVQAVLRDRFALVVHQEARESQIYALTVAKGGHKLVPAASPSTSLNINRRQEIIGKAAPMKNLAAALSMMLGHVVRDETGLDGSYDFRAEFILGDAPPDNDRPSIFTALPEQLGLRLESRRGPVPVLVVDKVAPPAEN